MSLVLLALALAAAPDAPADAGTPARPAALASTTTRTLTLDDVLAAADRAYPTLVAAAADVRAAEGEQLSAAGGFDPQLRARAFGVPVGFYDQFRLDAVVDIPTPLWGASFQAGYRLGVGNLESYYGERATWSGGELRAGVNVPLLRNGPTDRRRANVQRAELGLQLAGKTQEQQRVDIARLAANRYWDWVAAGQRRGIARALLQIAVDRDAQLGVRVKSGDVPEFDRLDNQRALVQRQAFVVQAQRGLENAAFELALFLRDEAGQPVQPDEARLPPLMSPPAGAPEDKADVDFALKQRPDVARLELQRGQQRVELELARNQLLPGLDVGATINGELGRALRPQDAPLGQARGGGSGYSPALEVYALLDVPLLFRAPLGRIQAAEAQVARLDAQLQLIRDRVTADVRDAVSALRAARQRVDFTQKEVEVARKLEQGERTRFERGDSNLLFVNIREQTTAEAQLREVDALADFQKAVAALTAALGGAMP